MSGQLRHAIFRTAAAVGLSALLLAGGTRTASAHLTELQDRNDVEGPLDIKEAGTLGGGPAPNLGEEAIARPRKAGPRIDVGSTYSN